MSLSMSRGDRCIEPPGVVSEQGGKGGEVMAQPLDQLLHRRRGNPDDQRAIPERARGLDQRSASSRRASIHALANGPPDVGEERTDEKERADGAEATHSLLERTVLRIEEPS